MSDVKDVELKDFSKETLEKQIELAKQLIEQSQTQIQQLQNQIQQQVGIAGFAQHLLTKFKIADKKDEPKKTSLEVK